jgi:cation diffusion facilitator CzcD-associated flavoprotein CzcO
MPLDTSHTHRVAVIGAGPGGICAAVRLRKAGIADFVVLERASGIGGTWRRNRYLGLACDIASHFYSFSFAPKPDWSRPFAGQAEILAYLEEVVSAFDIRRHIRFDTNVTAAHWDHETARWRLLTGDGNTVTAEAVVASPGMFGELRYPDVEGRDRFRGKSFHTGAWPADHSLSGERVAIIGSAASAVQLLPVAAKLARRVHLFQRSPNWVLPKEDVPFSAEQIEQFERSPASVAELRENLFRLYAPDPPFANLTRNAEMQQLGVASLAVVADPEVRARLTPTTPWGCHRPLFSNDYYPTFNQPHVELVTEPITRIAPSGVLTADGTEREVDTLIYATGYETTKFASVIDFMGRDGVHLGDAWADGAQAYLGVTTSGFPNLFMLYGPNTNAGSILYMIECQVDYVLRLLQHMQRDDLTWIDVRPDVMAAYNQQLQLDIEQVEVWQGGCSTYYRVPSGRIVTQWPHSMTRYREWTDTADPLDAYEVSHGRSLP